MPVRLNNCTGVIRIGGDPAGGSLGDYRDEELPPHASRHRRGDICLLILGHCLLGPAERDAALAAAVADGDLARVATWPGAYSVIVIRPGAVTAYGDLSEQFPLFYSQRGAEVLLAEDPAALAAAHAREPDLLTVAASIACPAVLPMWQTRSPYAGVSRVPGGAVLHAVPGSVRLHAGPVPLAVPGQTLEEGAARLREALWQAVRARCVGGKVSTDFSGGLDSTSIAFLAAAFSQSPVTAVAYHQPLAPAGDLSYATTYAGLDGNLSLRVVTGTPQTLPFAGRASQPDTVGRPAADEPHPGWLAAERSLARLAAARQAGARLHLTGEGGDAILMAAPSYLAALPSLSRPLPLLRHSAGYARLRQVTTARLAAAAIRLAATPPRRALSRLAAELAGTRPRPEGWSDLIAWWPPPGAAACWLTPAIRRQLADLAADPATAQALPDGAGPADLAALTDLRRSGDTQRQLRKLAAPMGLEVHAPFLDSAVIRAALSVPAPTRASPSTYKPLLGAALRGLVPVEVLSRRTKGDYAAEDYAGGRAAVDGLHALLRESRLAALGVIEPAAAAAAVDRLAAGVAVPLGPLNSLLAAESWLRQKEASLRQTEAAC